MENQGDKGTAQCSEKESQSPSVLAAYNKKPSHHTHLRDAIEGKEKD